MLRSAVALVGKTGCHVVNAFSTRLKLIWPISSLKIPRMSKNAFLAKSAWSQWVNSKVFGNSCASSRAKHFLSTVPLSTQARVVRKADNATHRINHYPVDSLDCFVNTYPLDSDLSGG